MTAYFDSKGTELRDIEAGVSIMGEWGRVEYDALNKLDESVVWDVTLAVESPGFPDDLRDHAHRLILKFSAACQSVGSPGPDYETIDDHARGIGNMISELHSLFHELVMRNPQGFSDSPLAPLRRLYCKGEEYRELLVAKQKQQEGTIK